jgi:ABC-2 type transport system ATP-binding protein
LPAPGGRKTQAMNSQPLPSSTPISSVAARPVATLGSGGRAVDFEGVTRSFGGVPALVAVDLTIPVGSTIALLGPNGAGKSTAIALMLGMLQPDRGTVCTLGIGPHDAVRSGRVGAMLQSGGLPSGARVGELVGFARRLYPRPLPLDVVLETAGLSNLADRTIDRLSGGETQRVRFALAIAGDPDLLFLDEPTVAMDVETRLAFWADMRRFAADGRTVLFATHYLEEADQVADRIVVLDNGRIVADGTPTSIKAGVASRVVRFTLTGAEPAFLAGLPGVSSSTIHGDEVSLVTSDADATVRALYAAGTPLHDLEVAGANLEAAFLALTTEGAPR